MSDDIYRVVVRDYPQPAPYIDVEFEQTKPGTRTIVSYGDDDHRRYLMTTGWRKYRGMYRNRRRVGSVASVWTSDRGKAHLFSSPSAARTQLAKEFGKASLIRYRFEAVKVTVQVHIVIYAANTERGITRRRIGLVEAIA